MKKKMKGGKRKTSAAQHHAHQEVHNHIHVSPSMESGNDADKALSKLKYKNYK